MKIKVLALGALAVAGMAAPAVMANQVSGRVARDWVIVAFTAQPPFGQPAEVQGLNNYKKLSDCTKAIDADLAANPQHWDYCAKFNHVDANPADGDLGGVAVIAPEF